MNGRIAVLCPTRGNPEAAERAYSSMRQTSELADMIFCVDEDDAEPHRYLCQFPHAWVSSEPRTTIVAALNAAVNRFSEYEAYGLIVDDARFVTPGWDRWLMEQFRPQSLGVVSAHHNVSGAVNFPYVHRDWVNLLGWYACPDTARFCWDTVLEMIGDATRIVYAPEDRFHIYHELLRNEQSIPAFAADSIQFLGWCVNARRLLIQKIREAM